MFGKAGARLSGRFRPYYAEHAGIFVLDPSLGFPATVDICLDICIFPRAGYNGHYNNNATAAQPLRLISQQQKHSSIPGTVLLPQLSPHRVLYDWVVAPCIRSWVVSKADRGLSGHGESFGHFLSAEDQGGSASWIHPATVGILIFRRALGVQGKTSKISIYLYSAKSLT